MVVFTKDPKASLGTLPLAHIDLLLQVWADRTAKAGQREEIAYVLPFENRGAEVGVTIHHPHGQIYAYPVVPPVPAKMQYEARLYHQRKGRRGVAGSYRRRTREGVRMIYEGPHAVAFVPVCARYPYEVWVAPIEPVESFVRLDPEQRADLARP